MKLHANARSCPRSGQLLVDPINAGWSVMEVAEAAGITDSTARREPRRVVLRPPRPLPHGGSGY